MLIVLTPLITISLRMAHLPAALMLGPMAAGIVTALHRPGASLPRWTTLMAQGVLGCLIACALSPPLLALFFPHWPVLVGINLVSILGIFAIGVAATRIRFYPGTAGIWGMSPGAAGAMVMLSEAYGGDKRLVAVMQYLRLVCAALTVVALGSWLGSPHEGPPMVLLPGGPSTPWFPPIDPRSLATTLSLVAAGMALTLITRRPVFIILFPVFAGVALQATGRVTLVVPPLASAAAFAVIGWHVGLSFTRPSLLYSARFIPRILAGIAVILLFCTGLSWLLTRLMPVDFLTACLALNPGSADVVMLMGASVAVDLPVIMTMQFTRLVLVMMLAPILGQFAARYFTADPGG
ncbi:AbrB family transcriptional regulator [Niveispirillum fermenti]|uniref:AbrB family transcriptional regulator n=1 Tax=Niveispirillum fermenti TaxID=1233113 RepID=UPI003A89086A